MSTIYWDMSNLRWVGTKKYGSLEEFWSIDFLLGWWLSIDHPLEITYSNGEPSLKSCMLCNNSLESRSHLFFCSFSWDVWLSSSQRLRFSSSILWEEILLELRNFVGNKTARTILLLASQATIYIIWTEKTASYIVTSFAMFFRWLWRLIKS